MLKLNKKKYLSLIVAVMMLAGLFAGVVPASAGQVMSTCIGRPGLPSVLGHAIPSAGRLGGTISSGNSFTASSGGATGGSSGGATSGSSGGATGGSSGGVNSNLVITQYTQNSSINPTTATFDLSNPAVVTTMMTLNGNTLSSIKNGSTTLQEGSNRDYTVSGNNVTINTSYLDNLTVGTTTLTFNFSSGASATLTITVVKDSSINPTTATFDLSNPAVVTTMMTLNGNTLSSIKNGSTTLQEGSNSNTTPCPATT